MIEDGIVQIEPAHIGAGQPHFLFLCHGRKFGRQFTDVGSAAVCRAQRQTSCPGYPVIVGEEAIQLYVRDHQVTALRDDRIMAAY